MEEEPRRAASGRFYCCVCEKRVAKTPYEGKVRPSACLNCWRRTGFEKTRAQYGLPLGTPRELWREELIRGYNKAVKDGLRTYREIGALLGIRGEQLRANVDRFREAGFKVEPHPTASNKIRLKVVPGVIMQPGSGPNARGHGEGKYGVPGCGCEACILVRRQSRRESMQKHRQKERQLLAESGTQPVSLRGKVKGAIEEQSPGMYRARPAPKRKRRQ